MRFRYVGDQTPCGSIQAREQCVLVGVTKRRLKRWCDTGLSQHHCDGNLRADMIDTQIDMLSIFVQVVQGMQQSS
jgi:hypothetical protein